jgi:hypothetical protein
MWSSCASRRARFGIHSDTAMPFCTLYRFQWVGMSPARTNKTGMGTEGRSSSSLTFRQGAHQSAEMVGLLEFALANLDDIRKVPPDLNEQLVADGALAMEQSVQRVLILVRGLREYVEILGERLVTGLP